ncbi:MG2 domain-containing protein [Sunxiuqinia sp. A32]|uniref:MG2 domain-containing protein n=1 Tax=Sunxiuqinia sp. A32 TaxID=3461496 RepID=UPI004045CE98
MKTIVVSFILLVAVLAAMSQEEKFEKTISQLNTYYKYYPGEKVYLKTNKDIFKPGESVWFSAVVKLYTSSVRNNLSNTLTVRLYDESGILILSDKFKIDQGRAAGDFTLPAKIESGKYFLAAFTNIVRDENDANLKMIYIDHMDSEAVQVDTISIPKNLVAGRINVLKYQLSEISGSPYKSNRVNFEFREGKEVIDEGKVKTESDGSLLLEVNVPDKSFDQPIALKLFDKAGHLNYRKSFHVNTQKLLLNFFAESGNFVAGSSMIGYKVTDESGNLIEIKGEIVDEAGIAITQVHTLIPGYGIIPIKTKSSEKYKFKITSELGHGQLFDLPSFSESGLLMSLQKIGSDFVQLGLNFNDQDEHHVYVMLSKGSEVMWMSDMLIKEGIVAKIPKENFQQGLAMLSAFDEKGDLLGRRLVFADVDTAINVGIKVSDEEVTAGNPFMLKVELKDQNGEKLNGKVNTAISIKDDLLPEFDDFTSCFIINSELEHNMPIAELMDKESIFESSFNYLLIANSFKNFCWDDILNFTPEDLGKYKNGIKGYVFDTNNNPVSNAKVSLVNSTNMQMLTQSTNDKGVFFFSGLEPKDANDYVIKAIDENGREDLDIELEKSFDEKLSLLVEQFAVQVSFREQPKFDKAFFENNADLFTKYNKAVAGKNNEPRYKAYLQTATSIVDVIKMIKPCDVGAGGILFAGSRNSINAQGAALIVIDGQQMGTSIAALNTISPVDVESIEISTNPVDIQRFTGLNSVGVIEIKTKRGENLNVESSEPNPHKYENGLRVPNDFMMIRAGAENQKLTSLYWSPTTTIKSAEEMSIEIPTGEVIGDFVIEVEAIDEQGRIGKATKTIRVTN